MLDDERVRALFGSGISVDAIARRAYLSQCGPAKERLSRRECLAFVERVIFEEYARPR